LMPLVESHLPIGVDLVSRVPPAESVSTSSVESP
jgi:hypothetical protein